MRQACSARLRRSDGSCLERAFANWAMNDLVSEDHLPPTSTARNTRRARDRGPTISGHVLSFLLRAACATTPSASAAVTVQCTHQRGVHCQLTSTKEREAVNDHLQPATVRRIWNWQIQIAHHHVGSDASQSLSANARRHAFQSKSKHSCPRTCSPVVAKRIDWTAAPAHVKRQGQKQREATQQDHPKQVRRDLREKGRGSDCGNQSCSWACLRPDQCPIARNQPFEEDSVPELSFHSKSNFVLPSLT